MKKALLVLGLTMLVVTSSMALTVGVENMGATASPFMRFQLSTDQAVDLGLTGGYTDSNNNNMTIWGRYEGKLVKAGDVNTAWGLNVGLTNTKVASATVLSSSISLELLASYSLTRNLAVYGVLNVLSAANTGTGSTTYSVLAGTPTTLYTGVRLSI